MTVDTKELVTTIAYLIGIKSDAIEQQFEKDRYEILKENKDATIVRYLCRLRSSLMHKFKQTDSALRYEMKNIDKLDWFNRDEIKQLMKWEIPVFQVNTNASEYMKLFCKLIGEYIDKCKPLFPEWIDFQYVREMFCIPKYNNEKVMKAEFDKFMGHLNSYPYQQYIYWRPYECGNMLLNDGKFLKVLYEQHNKVFEDSSKYKDAHDDTKNSIYDFVHISQRTVVAVDCENSDVYKLYSVLKGLNNEELDKIEKIVLFDDKNTTVGWKWLSKFTSIPVEHMEIERVMDRKSLVDVKMTAEVTKYHYRDDIDSFILVSSDSDYWGLITSLPDARFIVMYEYDKCSYAIKRTLAEHDIHYCSIDDFCSANVSEFKTAVLINTLKLYVNDIAYLNGKELVEQLYTETRINATDAEKENFYKRYIKTLSLKCDADGNFTIEIKT